MRWEATVAAAALGDWEPFDSDKRVVSFGERGLYAALPALDIEGLLHANWEPPSLFDSDECVVSFDVPGLYAVSSAVGLEELLPGMSLEGIREYTAAVLSTPSVAAAVGLEELFPGMSLEGIREYTAAVLSAPSVVAACALSGVASFDDERVVRASTCLASTLCRLRWASRSCSLGCPSRGFASTEPLS